jgi:hypothetical protein
VSGSEKTMRKNDKQWKTIKKWTNNET